MHSARPYSSIQDKKTQRFMLPSTKLGPAQPERSRHPSHLAPYMVFTTVIIPTPMKAPAATVTNVPSVVRPWPNGPSQFEGTVSAISSFVSAIVWFATVHAAPYAIIPHTKSALAPSHYSEKQQKSGRERGRTGDGGGLARARVGRAAVVVDELREHAFLTGHDRQHGRVVAQAPVVRAARLPRVSVTLRVSGEGGRTVTLASARVHGPAFGAGFEHCTYPRR